MEMVGKFCQILELGGTTIKGRKVVPFEEEMSVELTDDGSIVSLLQIF